MRSMRKNNRLPGFTLVELLFTVCLVGVLSLVVYATLSNGIRLWQRMNQDLVLADVNIFLDRFSTDVKNSFVFAGIDFTGDNGRLELAAVVKSPRFEGKTVGKIVYVYNQDKKELQRQFKDYPGVYSREEGRTSHRLRNIRSLSFEYYYFDKEKKEYQWKEEWVDTALPLAIKMALELSDGTKTYGFTKTVSVPCAG